MAGLYGSSWIDPESWIWLWGPQTRWFPISSPVAPAYVPVTIVL
jgi:hypothetical protein